MRRMEGRGLGHLLGEPGCLISDLVGVGNAPTCWLESPWNYTSSICVHIWRINSHTGLRRGCSSERSWIVKSPVSPDAPRWGDSPCT